MSQRLSFWIKIIMCSSTNDGSKDLRCRRDVIITYPSLLDWLPQKAHHILSLYSTRPEGFGPRQQNTLPTERHGHDLPIRISDICRRLMRCLVPPDTPIISLSPVEACAVLVCSCISVALPALQIWMSCHETWTCVNTNCLIWTSTDAWLWTSLGIVGVMN